jgi:4-hydroxythreonine-4-phosphate dehydrogenase
MTDLVIVADDLTGAGDSAAYLARTASVSVVLDGAAQWPSTTVVAVDTDSRYAGPKEAASRTADAVRRAQDLGATVYKKIDSTLRGNVAVEVRAAAEALATAEDRPLVIVAPAFPAVDRTTVGGVVHIKGEPMTEGAYGGNLLRLLDEAALSSILIPLGLARHEGDLGQQFLIAHENGVDAVVVDAESDEDLAKVVQAARSLPFSALLVGSGGLARPLSEGLSQTPERSPFELAAPALFVVGSHAAESREQRSVLVDRGVEEILLGPGTSDDAVAAVVRDKLHSGSVVLSPDPHLPVDRDQAPAVAASLANIALSVLDGVKTLVATGGETARAILDRAGITQLEVRGELEPGLVLYHVPALNVDLVTKAGAFGDSHTLLRCRPAAQPKEIGTMSRPIIAITMGDAAGVGPEIIAKALAARQVYDRSRPLVIGDAKRMRRAIEITKVPLTVNPVDSPESAAYKLGVIDCIDLDCVPEDLPFGELSAIAGDAAYRFIELAVELAVARRVDAICTAPLNKEALHAGGHNYPGHTEMLAKLTGTEEVSMLLNTPKLRVIHVTTHIGLIDMVEKINPGLVERTIRRGHDTLVKAGIPHPKIAVCGINPHAGEHGLFGRGEEEEKVAPGVEAARAAGIDAVGPLPADTVFFLAGRGDFDLVVAMYHDQGHGPVKVLGLEQGVNITIGLPVIRTSVDHGTAFDIAGTGVVDEASMIEALRQAADLAPKDRQKLDA